LPARTEPRTIADNTQVVPAEMKEIVTAFKDKGDANGVKRVQSSGLHVAGERFVVLKADERSLYGKKVRSLAHCHSEQHLADTDTDKC